MWTIRWNRQRRDDQHLGGHAIERAWIGAQVSLWLECTGDVADQHTADRDEAAGMMPAGSPGHDPNQAFVAAIPARDLEPPPARFAINEALGEGRLARPVDPAVKSAAPL